MPTTDFALSDADNDTRGGDARGVIGGSDGGTDSPPKSALIK